MAGIDVDEEGLRLAILHDNLDEVDYYALLECPPSADTSAVRDAFHSFALKFHPDQHVGDATRQRRALAIFKRGAEAYRVLMNPALRARWDKARAQGASRLSPDAMQLPPDARLAVDVPAAARPYYEKAQEALARGDVGGAKMHLALARGRGESAEFDKLAARIDAAAPPKRK